MLRSLYSAISGMNAFQTSLDVTGNNIANVDTTGFKTGRVEFSDILSQTLSGASSPTAAGTTGPGGTNPQQVGLGVNVASIDTLFTQGADQQTGVPTDIALNGDGMFAVSTSAPTTQPVAGDTTPTPTAVGSNSVAYTRAGNFTVDAAGNLVLPNGAKLLGYLLTKSTTTGTTTTVTSGSTSATGVVTDANGNTIASPSNLSAVNISVGQQTSGGSLTVIPGNFSIGANGQITVSDPNNPNFKETWQVPLAQFFNPGGMQKAGGSMYVPTTNSGQFLATPTPTQGASLGVPGQNGFASFRVGYLEASNVNLTNEFTNMIIAQQGFDANSKVINTDNNILSTIQNLEQQA